MRYFVQWTSDAFHELEGLDQKAAFKVLQQLDLLSDFPEMGPDLGSWFPGLSGLRQIVVNSEWRVIYELDKRDNDIWVLAIQKCRQNPRTKRKLKQ